jgi:hypothetical protein
MSLPSEPASARVRPTGRSALRLAAVAAALALALPAPARGEGWTRTDTAFELGLVALSITDFGQTSWFLSHRPRAYETNPLLGRHPSRSRVAAFGAVALGSHAVVARLLPQPYRRLWQLAGIGVEVDAVTSNAMTFGFHLSF